MIEIQLNLPGRVYQSDMPWSVQYDETGALIEEYRRRRVDVVVVLSPDEEIRQNTGRDLVAIYRAEGWEVIHLSVPNLGVPARDDLCNAVNLALMHAQAGRCIVVHCHAGIGRTGMFLAVLSGMALGMGSESAIAYVRRFVEGAVETEEQFAMVGELLDGRSTAL